MGSAYIRIDTTHDTPLYSATFLEGLVFMLESVAKEGARSPWPASSRKCRYCISSTYLHHVQFPGAIIATKRLGDV